eukprot:scaffold328087_cov18-Prasinocladus_malaysianus.AAC.1
MSCYGNSAIRLARFMFQNGVSNVLEFRQHSCIASLVVAPNGKLKYGHSSVDSAEQIIRGSCNFACHKYCLWLCLRKNGILPVVAAHSFQCCPQRILKQTVCRPMPIIIACNTSVALACTAADELQYITYRLLSAA